MRRGLVISTMLWTLAGAAYPSPVEGQVKLEQMAAELGMADHVKALSVDTCNAETAVNINGYGTCLITRENGIYAVRQYRMGSSPAQGIDFDFLVKDNLPRVFGVRRWIGDQTSPRRVDLFEETPGHNTFTMLMYVMLGSKQVGDQLGWNELNPHAAAFQIGVYSDLRRKGLVSRGFYDGPTTDVPISSENR